MVVLFIQIGSDGGLLEKPVIMNEIIIAPAERVDVIINFADVRSWYKYCPD